MERARILIVEDQVVVAKSIEAMVIEHGLDPIGICKTGEEALELVERVRPDIVIMDIKLQGKMDGIKAASSIHELYRIPVIFLSDYTDKATVRHAKSAQPVNYLSKPFTEGDLLRAIDIAIYNANAARAIGDNDSEFVFLKIGPKTHAKLEYNNIIYLEADRSYCKIQSTDQLHSVALSMASVAEQLNPERFIKIHRSFIVNLRKIREYSGNEVNAAGYRLPVSDQHRTELITRLKVLH